MMIPRDISGFTNENAAWFPIVAVTGPRQSGKSTLVKEIFTGYEYENLELPGTRQIAQQDPMGFIRERGSRLIIDEAQLAPDLFSVIQVESDAIGNPGQYILSGSQNFILRKQITQSLAGRVGMVTLLPLSYREIMAAETQNDLMVDEFALKGGFPRLYTAGIPAEIYFRNYLATYVERDVSGYVDAGNLQSFETFIRLCAQSCGSLLNITRLASDTGISTKTARSWLSILEASYVLFRLHPHHANLRKRLTKTPKVYFYDTGLLCHMLGLKTLEQFRMSTYRGAVFENQIVLETLKRHINAGRDPQLRFYRDDSKIEVDLVDITNPNHPELVEIKSSSTYNRSFTRNLESIGKALGVPPENRSVVMRECDDRTVEGMHVVSADTWFMRT